MVRGFVSRDSSAAMITSSSASRSSSISSSSLEKSGFELVSVPPHRACQRVRLDTVGAVSEDDF